MLLTRQQLSDSGVCELYLKWAASAATPSHYNFSATMYSLGHNNQPLHRELTFNIPGVNKGIFSHNIINKVLN